MRLLLLCALSGLAFPAVGCSDPAGAVVHIDPAGGTVPYSNPANPALNGTSVAIPPGALQQPADIQIMPCDGLAMGQEVAAGPCVRFLPATLVFTAPVTLTIPYQPLLVPAQQPLGIKTLFNAQSSTIPSGALRTDSFAKLLATDVRNLGDYQAVTTPTPPPPPPPPPTQNVDILFVIDNSPSMVGKQQALAKNIPAFLQKLDDAGLNYHIGIATSDVGSNVMPGTPWGGSIGKCDTYEGDDGALQAIPCSNRTDVTSVAKNACAALCPDDKFVPTDGHRFISKVAGVTNVPTSLELDPMSGKMVDRGPSHAFQCIGLVGDSGCGIEGQLAGARRALDGHRSENVGFLRPGSLLAVLFLTDEDDCSVQIARRSENNPVTMDCAPDQNANYSCYNVDYRCLARSVQCNEPMNSVGVKTGCKERPGNYLDATDKYVTFLQALRPATRLVVGGIWTLPTITSGGKLIITRTSGGTTTPFLNRAPGSDASCTYSGDATIFGQAQLRLSQFAAGFGKDAMDRPNAQESSICDLDQYGTSLGQFAATITTKLK